MNVVVKLCEGAAFSMAFLAYRHVPSHPHEGLSQHFCLLGWCSRFRIPICIGRGVETPAHAFRCGCELEGFTVDAHLKPFSLLEKDKERLPLLSL